MAADSMAKKLYGATGEKMPAIFEVTATTLRPTKKIVPAVPSAVPNIWNSAELNTPMYANLLNCGMASDTAPCGTLRTSKASDREAVAQTPRPRESSNLHFTRKLRVVFEERLLPPQIRRHGLHYAIRVRHARN